MPKNRQPKSSRFPQKQPKGLPDRDTLIKHIRESGETNKAEIAKAFGLKGEDRRALRHMLAELEAEGALGRRGRRGFAEAGALPEVGVVDVVERDPDGDLLVRLTKGGEDAPLVVLAPPRRDAAAPAPGLGDRLLVRFVALEAGGHEAQIIKALGAGGQRLLGVVRKARRETRVEPVD
ncbi:MAG: ribonuclease R, partial [Proteobacteria bacterium]|nr:ribonuclease R [Pseudomonadota bacterium]